MDFVLAPRDNLIRKLRLVLLVFSLVVFCNPGNAEESLPHSGIIKVVYFYTESCSPCRWMTPIIGKLDQKYANSVRIIKIDAHDDADLAREYGVKAVPTSIFLDKDHREVYRRKGFMSQKQIESQLKKMGAND